MVPEPDHICQDPGPVGEAQGGSLRNSQFHAATEVILSLQRRQRGPGHNAFQCSWKDFKRAYAFPPPQFIPQVLAKIVQDQVELVLVAPCLEHATWFGELISLLAEPRSEVPPAIQEPGHQPNAEAPSAPARKAPADCMAAFTQSISRWHSIPEDAVAFFQASIWKNTWAGCQMAWRARCRSVTDAHTK